MDRKAILAVSLLAGFVGGLCCLPPILLVLLGLTNISLAASFGDVLYGEYRWIFRLLALVFIGSALVLYFRKRGVCSLDEAARRRNWVINVALLALMGSVAVYVFWTYVVLHYWGIAAGLPWAQYDESWAIPTSAVLFGIVAYLFFSLRTGPRKAAKE